LLPNYSTGRKRRRLEHTLLLLSEWHGLLECFSTANEEMREFLLFSSSTTPSPNAEGTTSPPTSHSARLRAMFATEGGVGGVWVQRLFHSLFMAYLVDRTTTSSSSPSTTTTNDSFFSPSPNHHFLRFLMHLLNFFLILVIYLTQQRHKGSLRNIFRKQKVL
jgi:hypothetical protein